MRVSCCPNSATEKQQSLPINRGVRQLPFHAGKHTRGAVIAQFIDRRLKNQRVESLIDRVINSFKPYHVNSAVAVREELKIGNLYEHLLTFCVSGKLIRNAISFELNLCVFYLFFDRTKDAIRVIFLFEKSFLLRDLWKDH